MTTSLPPTTPPPNSDYSYYSPPPAPTPEQLERDRQLKRFNRLYVYLPLGAGIFITLTIIILLLIGMFVPGLTGAEAFMSAMADLIIILWSLPMLILCAIVPLGYLAYVLNRRQKRKLQPQTGPLANRSRVQILLWRIQSFLDSADKQTEGVSDRIAAPIIRLNSYLSSTEAWLNNLKEQIRGSNKHDDANDAAAE